MRFATLSRFAGLLLCACSTEESGDFLPNSGETVGNTGGAQDSSRTQSSVSHKGGQSAKGGTSNGGSRTTNLSTQSGGTGTSSAKAKGGSSSSVGGTKNSSNASSAGGAKDSSSSKSTGGTKSSVVSSGGSSGTKASTTKAATTSASGGTANTSSGKVSTGGTSNTASSRTEASSGGMDAKGGSATGGALTTGPQASCGDVAADSGSNSSRDTTTQILVDGRDKNYTLLPNWWKKYDGQSIAYKGLSFTVNDPKNVSSGADTDPTGYPTLFIGQYAGAQSKGSNLPKQVSALTTIPTIFSTNALDRDHSQFNAAYDVWFTAGSSPIPAGQFNPGSGGAYLMVWYYKPGGRQPRGGNCGGGGCQPNQQGHNVAGVSPGSWDVWIDNTNPPCISYVSTSPIASMSFDLNKFIQDAVNNNYGIRKEMYLSVVFAGFEIWGGGNGLQVKQFCAHVN